MSRLRIHDSVWPGATVDVMFRSMAVAAALLWTTPARAGQATCSNPGLPVGAAASSELMPGRLTLNLTTGLLPIGSEEVLDEASGPVLYDTRLVLVETRLAAEYAVTPWLAFSVAAPYRTVAIDVTHRDPDSGDPVPAPTTIHSRTETIHGFGDLLLGAHVARELGAVTLHGRAGASVPVGRTEEDPHLLGSIGQEHQHVQLGTGTVVPFAAIEVQRAIAGVTLAGFALARLSLYDNGKGYRAGDQFSGGVTASSSLGLRAWTFSAALEGHGETAETWQGMVYETEGNAGRFDLLTGLVAAWRPTKSLAVVADVKLPIYSHVSGTQLDYGIVLGFGVVATFDLVKRASWGGLDHETIAPAGTAPDLRPVPGRITVFDLWADWCAPCRELDTRLEALARANPDRLAIRKLDVVDSDSAAWQRHLAPGSFDLPHVKVFGPDGKLVFERTASPAELVRAIEALLR
jgi:thiol-disulfide isomerase/thioredoxin